MKDSKITHGTEISGPEMVADKTVKTSKKMASKTARFLSKSVKGAVKGAIEAKTVDVEMPTGEAIAKPTHETEVFAHHSRPSSLHSATESLQANKIHPTVTHKTPTHNESVIGRTSRKVIDISNIQALQADMSEQFE